MVSSSQAVPTGSVDGGPRWEPGEDTTLDSLLTVAGWKEDEREARGSPWAQGHEMHYAGVGGMQVRDKRRVTVAASKYSNRVDGGRDVYVKGDLTFELDGGNVSSISPTGSGSNNIHVKGNMRWKVEDRMIIGTGTVNRTWYGPVRRILAMEGIICGGAFAKAYLGGSTTVGALSTGDVYGGAARTSACRSYVAGISYRTTSNALWQLGLYARTTYVTMVPVIGSPSSTVKPTNQRNHFAKIAGKIAMSVLPFLSILWGAVTAPIMIPLAIICLVRLIDVEFFAAPKPQGGPPMLPRVLTRTVGFSTTATASVVET